MEKGGLSGIITAVLLILIIIVAIGIIWTFVQPSITNLIGGKGKTGEFSKFTQCLDIKIKPTTCVTSVNEQKVTIQRGSGKETIDEIKFIFETQDSQIILTDQEAIFGNIPNEFGSSEFIFNQNLENIVSLKIATKIEGNFCEPATEINCYRETTQGEGEEGTCNDGDDNDDDGLTDFPNDPGCDSPTDGDETNHIEMLFYAYAWESVDRSGENLNKYNQEYKYIIPWPRINQNTPQEANESTSLMPEGHKVLFDFNSDLDLSRTQSDFCTDPESGNITRCLWYDNGLLIVKQTYNAWFNEYKNIGGQADAFILDNEHIKESRDAINARKNDGWTNGSLDEGERTWNAIQNDQRNTSVFNLLGFDNIQTVWNFSVRIEGNSYIWDDVMLDWATEWLNNATYNVIAKYYPNIKMSNYGFYHYSQEFPFIGNNGQNTSYTGDGTHIGTHQSTGSELYGNIGFVLEGMKLDGENNYVATPFNGFRLNTNQIRAMKLSSTTPIYPWIDFYSFDPNDNGQYLISNNNYFKENLFHILLTSPDKAILYWNPHGTGSSKADLTDDVIMNNTLAEFNQIAGYQDSYTLVGIYENLAPWGDDYVLTGIRSADRNVWRFTPDIINGTHVVNQTSNPVIITTEKSVITIQEASIYTPTNPMSDYGYWIIQPSTAEYPIIT